MDFVRSIRTTFLEKVAAVIGLDRDKFRRGANFPQ